MLFPLLLNFNFCRYLLFDLYTFYNRGHVETANPLFPFVISPFVTVDPVINLFEHRINKTKLLTITFLTSSHRMSYKLAMFCWNGERLNTHSDFCVFWPGALLTRHPWRAIALADVCTHKCFSASMGSRFSSPGQKALPAMNEFTLLWIFA